MTILEKITAYKRKEVEAKKEAFPLSIIESLPYYERDCISMAHSIRNSNTGIIAEHKRRSPSKSVINDKVLLPEVVKGYENAGVSAISILTDTKFFGGSLEDLVLARHSVSIPLLRKEFIVDPYQIHEAKAHGADAILLIAACLSEEELKSFSALAKELGLDVLLEVHNEVELNKSLHPTVDLLGVNNRNLKTFEVSLDTSKALSEKIPNEFVKVSESGISSLKAINELRQYGFQGFLMGEYFMKSDHPGNKAKEFIDHL
ncbi:indole-3-glycerol phosphate synthase TrpC [Aureisphaera galaxeae]|uniref:indole-3-glycerol phosphate synthase TrpC n=1 Tax=Aureisphaera galaxeae TaxID=1538023 RepID=UPI00234FD20D|nr:indole-3-glycerol phosphate synthase TrpC [Aureisphaera galaxeae]MDC8004423.1 indole-3-glycerol phosphate synthase TrpC [Aureisphaera galaxeae]